MGFRFEFPSIIASIIAYSWNSWNNLWRNFMGFWSEIPPIIASIIALEIPKANRFLRFPQNCFLFLQVFLSKWNFDSDAFPELKKIFRFFWKKSDEITRISSNFFGLFLKFHSSCWSFSTNHWSINSTCLLKDFLENYRTVSWDFFLNFIGNKLVIFSEIWELLFRQFHW